jgi:hypothetical protein
MRSSIPRRRLAKRAARKSAVPKSGTAPAFTKAHAKRTGRSPSAVAQDAAEAKTLGDETLQRIAGTSLDTPSEVAALAAMAEQERQQFIERCRAKSRSQSLLPGGPRWARQCRRRGCQGSRSGA